MCVVCFSCYFVDGYEIGEPILKLSMCIDFNNEYEIFLFIICSLYIAFNRFNLQFSDCKVKGSFSTKIKSDSLLRELWKTP